MKIKANLILLCFQLIARNSSEQTQQQMPIISETEQAEIDKNTIKVDEIAGQSEKAVNELLGKSQKRETVKPSRTLCPCPKMYYLNGTVEVVFIDDKADWITIKKPSIALIKNDNIYQSVQRFDDYTYIKVKSR